MKRREYYLRWIGTVPVLYLGWQIGILFGYFVVMIGEVTCPAEHVVSNHCFAPWTDLVFRCATVIGSMVAASLVVWLPAVVAPSHKHLVAVSAFVLGVTVAISLALALEAWLPFWSAVATGAVAVWLVMSRDNEDPRLSASV